MAGALSSFEEPKRYEYFWNQGVKLHNIGGAILFLAWSPH